MSDSPAELQTILGHAEEQCRARGTRLTEKRKKVLSGLLQSERSLSAYELIDYCNEHYDESFPAMSVYRILDFLEEEQLVHKLNLSSRYVACVHISCDHEHEVPQFLICTECQRVKEISIGRSTLATIRRRVEEASFHLVSPQLELNCVCEECAAA